MATNNKKEESNTIKTTETEQPVIIDSSKPAVSRPCSMMNSLTPLIAVAALLITGYSYYSSMRLNQNITKENKQLATELRQLQQQQNGLQQHLSTQTSEQQQTIHEVEQKIADASKQIQSLSDQKGTKNQDWLLLKARYYLELAQINAHWNRSANDHTTSELLQQADTILGQINTSNLFEIRQTIANEIMTLKTNKPLDIPGLLSQLHALQNSVSELNFQTAVNPNHNLNVKEEQSSANESSWKTHLHNSLGALSKLIVVRRNDEEIKPLLSPIYESILKESIRLNLQQAQWALINSSQTTFQLALNQAVATLKRGFNEHLSNTAVIINQLIKLQKVQVNAEKPEIGQALPLLNQLIDQQMTKPKDQNNREQKL
jgi:uroporphyrin-3 C-methyltransferase